MKANFNYWVCRFKKETTFRLYSLKTHFVPRRDECVFYWKGNERITGKRKMKEANMSRKKGGFLF